MSERDALYDILGKKLADEILQMAKDKSDELHRMGIEYRQRKQYQPALGNALKVGDALAWQERHGVSLQLSRTIDAVLANIEHSERADKKELLAQVGKDFHALIEHKQKAQADLLRHFWASIKPVGDFLPVRLGR